MTFCLDHPKGIGNPQFIQFKNNEPSFIHLKIMYKLAFCRQSRKTIKESEGATRLWYVRPRVRVRACVRLTEYVLDNVSVFNMNIE